MKGSNQPEINIQVKQLRLILRRKLNIDKDADGGFKMPGNRESGLGSSLNNIA